MRLEKASLKSDIEILELQFQRSLSFILPFDPTEPSDLIAQSTSCPIVPHDAPSDPIPVHSPGLQSVPFLKNPSVMPSKSDSTFSSFHLALATPSIDEPSTSFVSTSYNPLQKNFESKASNNKGDEVKNHGSLVTELELMPGSISKKVREREILDASFYCISIINGN